MIKVCGITNLQDAIAAVDAGADAIGFNFFPHSKRYIRPEVAESIAARLDGRVLRVGVFVNEPPASLQRIAAVCGLDIVQLHGNETPDQAPSGLRVWKAFRVEEGFDLSAALASFPHAEAVLLDGPAGAEFGGSGKPFLWQVARGAARPVVLAGGLNASNVQAAIHAAQPWGVDACSGLESAPGIKDHSKMKHFVDAARAAEVGI